MTISYKKIDTINLDEIENQELLHELTAIVTDLFNGKRQIAPLDQGIGLSPRELPSDHRIIHDLFKLASTPQNPSTESARYPRDHNSPQTMFASTSSSEVTTDSGKSHPIVNPVDNMTTNLLSFFEPETALKIVNKYTNIVDPK